jgi:hypothetical protein
MTTVAGDAAKTATFYDDCPLRIPSPRLRVLTKQAAPLLARVAEDGEDDGKPGALRH